MRQMRTFPGHDGLDKYAGQARYHAVDAQDGWDADEAISWLNKRADPPLCSASAWRRIKIAGLHM